MRTAGFRAPSSAPGAEVRQDKPVARAQHLAGAGTDAAASSALPVIGTAEVAAARPRDGGTRRAASPDAPAHRASPGPGLTSRRPPMAAVGVRRGLSRLRDRHPGQPCGSSPGFDHRPLGLAWAEAVETLTWAEKGTPAIEQRCPSLLWPGSGREQSAPDPRRLGVGRVRASTCCGEVLRQAWM